MEELRIITEREYKVLMPIIIEENRNGDKIDANQCMEDLLLIDRALIMMKAKSLMNRRSPQIKKQLDALLEASVTGKQPVWDSRASKYHFH